MTDDTGPARSISGGTTVTLSLLVTLLGMAGSGLISYATMGADVRHLQAGQQELRDDAKTEAARSEATRERVTSLEARMSAIDQTLGRIEGKVDKLQPAQQPVQAAPVMYRRVAR